MKGSPCYPPIHSKKPPVEGEREQHLILLPQFSFETMSSATKDKHEPTFGEIMNKAAQSAVRGGTAGAIAMGANVAALMWIRTTVRLQ